VLVGASLGHGFATQRAEDAARQARLEQFADDPCLGAIAPLNPDQCGDPFTTPLTAPVTEADSPWENPPECDPGCWEDSARPGKVVALVGDSHAQVLWFGLEPVMTLRGYGIAAYLKGSCPFNLTGSDGTLAGPRDPAVCGDWSLGVLEDIRDMEPDLIISTAFADSSWSDRQAGIDGYHHTWEQLVQIAPVVVIRDHPTTGGVWGPECLAQNPGNPEACSLPRSQALMRDVAWDAAGDGAPEGSVASTSPTCSATRHAATLWSAGSPSIGTRIT